MSYILFAAAALYMARVLLGAGQFYHRQFTKPNRYSRSYRADRRLRQTRIRQYVATHDALPDDPREVWGGG